MLAALAVISSALVVGQRSPMYSVMLLIVSFGALSGLYVLLDAPFTGLNRAGLTTARLGDDQINAANFNSLIEDLVWPTTEVTRAVGAEIWM